MTTLALTIRPLEFFLAQYRRIWRASLVSSVVTPIVYLLALGVGMGAFIGDVTFRGQTYEYFQFVAPGLLAATALIFGAAYTLWMYKRVYLGPVGNDHVKELQDINCREFLILAILAVAVLYMGLYPKPFTDVMDPSVAQLLQHVAQSKLP